MPAEAKTSNVGHGLHPVQLAQSKPDLIQRAHLLLDRLNVCCLRHAAFLGRRHNANAQRFGEEKGVPTLSGVVLF